MKLIGRNRANAHKERQLATTNKPNQPSILLSFRISQKVSMGRNVIKNIMMMKLLIVFLLLSLSLSGSSFALSFCVTLFFYFGVYLDT